MRHGGGVAAATCANSRQLDHRIGNRQKLRHRANGLTSVVSVKPGHVNLPILPQKRLYVADNLRVEELRFVYGHHTCRGSNTVQKADRIAGIHSPSPNAQRLKVQASVRTHHADAIASVRCWHKDLSR